MVESRTQEPLFILKEKVPFSPPENATIVKTLYFSVDPVMYVWLSGAPTNYRRVQIGDVFNCFGLGIVVKGTIAVKVRGKRRLRKRLSSRIILVWKHWDHPIFGFD